MTTNNAAKSQAEEYLTLLASHTAKQDKQLTHKTDKEQTVLLKKAKTLAPRIKQVPYGEPVRLVSKLLNIPSAQAYQVLKSIDWQLDRLIDLTWASPDSDVGKDMIALYKRISVLESGAMNGRKREQIVKEMSEDARWELGASNQLMCQ